MIVTRTHLMLIGLVAAILVLAAACAGGSDDGGETTAPDAVPALDPLSSGDGDEAGSLLVGESAARSFDDGSAQEAPNDGTSGSDPALQGLLDRKIIQSTSVDIEVEDVSRNFQEIIRIAQTAGGLVDSSSFSNYEETQTADITIRVPVESYQDVLAQLRGLGMVTQENSDANDVTEEFTDLQARLRTLEATEQRYLELLGQAKSIDEILTVQDRLDGVRGQIEQVQGRINMLENLTDLGTITVHLRLPAEGTDPSEDDGDLDPLDAAASAWHASLSTLRVLAAVGLAVVAYSWWLVPPLAVVGITSRWWVTRRP